MIISVSQEHIGDTTVDVPRFVELLNEQLDARNVGVEAVPSSDDDEEWNKIAALHMPICDWVLTRAHSRLGGAS